MNAKRAMRGQAFGASEPSRGFRPVLRDNTFHSRASGAVLLFRRAPMAGELCILINPLLGGAGTSQRPKPDCPPVWYPDDVPAVLACWHDKLHA